MQYLQFSGHLELFCRRSINTYVAYSEYVVNVDSDVAIHTHK